MAERWYATLYDGAANSAKFYDLTWNDDGSVVAVYGRVGATNPQRHSYTGGFAVFDRKRTEKMRKGYREVELADSPQAVKGANGAVLERVARKGLIGGKTGDPILDALVRRIAAANKHVITTATGGKITVSDSGKVLLPGGITLSAGAVSKARVLLDRLEQWFTVAVSYRTATSEWTSRLRARQGWLEEYLSLVPHAIPISGRGWQDRLLTSVEEYQREHALLDALEAVVNAPSDGDPSVDFRYQIAVASDEVFSQVKAAYEKASLASHPVSRLTVKRVFVLTDRSPVEVTEYAARVGNVAERWHGTGTANVLNILRTGLVHERSATMDFHGGLFGPGIYSSSMSTKAAGYGYGTWGGQRDEDCYVFLADIARGMEYRITPERYDWQGSRKPRTRKDGSTGAWNSVEVYSAVNGARNPETVVWDTDAVALRYLVQLGR